MARILLISDIENMEFFECNSEQLQEIDFVLSCGDLSLSYLSAVQQLLQKPLYFVYGNHGQKGRLSKGIKCIDGKIVREAGLVIAGIDGIVGKDDRKLTGRVRRLLRRKQKVDILVTHCPTEGLGDGCGTHRGCKSFYDLYEPLGVRVHAYGHEHLSYGGKRKLQYQGVQLFNAYDHIIIEVLADA